MAKRSLGARETREGEACTISPQENLGGHESQFVQHVSQVGKLCLAASRRELGQFQSQDVSRDNMENVSGEGNF